MILITRMFSYAELSNGIEGVEDDILRAAIRCEDSDKAFCSNRSEVKIFPRGNNCAKRLNII